jgi:hypothetical protein
VEWTCPSCDTSNESHLIFCATCGAMRHKRPARPDPPPAQQEPAEAPPASRFQGSVAGFTARWVGATSAAAFFAWIVQYGLMTLYSPLYTSLGGVVAQLAISVLNGLIYGFLIGALQAGTLNRTVEGRWGGWLAATGAGTVLASLTVLFQPEGTSLRSPLGGFVWVGLSGLAGGGVMGFLQALALRRNGVSGGVLLWTAVVALASALGNAAGHGAWSSLVPSAPRGSASFLLPSFALVAADTLVTSFLSGLALGARLRRSMTI